MEKKKITCTCGKRLAMQENDIVYLWCKSCKREIPFRIISTTAGTLVLKPIE